MTLRSDPPEGVRIVVDEEDLTAIEGWVQGPGMSRSATTSTKGVGREEGNRELPRLALETSCSAVQSE